MIVEIVLQISLFASVAIRFLDQEPFKNHFLFTEGITSKMANITDPNPPVEEASWIIWMKVFVALARTCCQLVEMSSYIAIHVICHKNDKVVGNSISKKNIDHRKKQNIITLSSQVTEFVLKILCNVIVITVVLVKQTDDSSFAYIVGAYTDAIISIVHVLASNDMRQYFMLKIMTVISSARTLPS